MTRRQTFIISAVLIFLGAISPSWVYGEKESIKQINEMLDDEKKELEKLRKKILQREKQISTIGQAESSILANLAQLEDKLKARERELKIYEWNIQTNKKKTNQLIQSINRTKINLAKRKLVVGKRLRTIYKEGNLFPIKILFAADNFNDLVYRLKYLEMTMQYDSSVFWSYKDKLEKFQSEKEALLGARNNLLILEKDVRGKKEQLLVRKNEKASFLKLVKGKKKFTIKARKELEQASKGLNDLISRLEKKLVLGKKLNFQDKKGHLKIPVRGKILNKFGKSKDKRYGSVIVYNGINIKSKKGTSVRSIFTGEVLYTGSLEGYGNLIIIGHGDKYHSLYGHLDKILVKVGDVVNELDVIGESGDSGSMVGETLYLELRHEGKPIEPTRWFKIARK